VSAAWMLWVLNASFGLPSRGIIRLALGSVNKQLPAFEADFSGKTGGRAGTYSLMDP
jgi:hypothetical protein